MTLRASGYRIAVVVALTVPLLFLAVFFLWPVLTLMGLGFTGTGAGTGAGAATASAQIGGGWFTNPRTWTLVVTTVRLAAAGTGLSILCGLPLAFCLYKLQFPGRTLIRGLIVVPFVLPTVAVSAGFHALLTRGGWLHWLGWEATGAAIIAAMVFFNTSLIARTVGTMWARLDPRPAQAALTLGAHPARVFATITLPALGPAIVSAASLVFLYCSTAYSLVMVLGGGRVRTLETQIYQETTQYLNLQGAAVLSIFQIVIVAAALLLSQHTARRTETTLKLRETPVQRPLVATDLPIVAASVLVVATVIVLPLVNIVLRSFQRGGHWTLANYRDLADAGASRVLEVSVLQSAWITVYTAAEAAVIAVIVGVLIALIVSRPIPRANTLKRRGQALYDVLFMLPLGVSAVTVGFGFLVTLDAPPLNLSQHGLMVPLAQAVVAIPLVVRVITPPVRAIDQRQRQAAAVLGATPARVLATIDGPFVLRAGLVAAGFAMAVCMGEFGATSFLVRPQNPTLPVVIYKLISRPAPLEQGMAMAAAVILCVLAAAIMVGVERLRTERGM